jgi:hypothetical protein
VFHQLVRGASIIAYAGEELITGRMAPLARGQLQLSSTGGVERYSTPIDSNSVGEYTVRATGPGGEPLALRTGDVVKVELSDQSTEMRVARLDYDFAIDHGILGIAPSSETVNLTLAFHDGRSLRTQVTADEAGRFVFGPDERLVRETWDFSDIVAIRAEVSDQNGHLTVRRTSISVPGGSELSTLFVPFVVSRY